MQPQEAHSPDQFFSMPDSTLAMTQGAGRVAAGQPRVPAAAAGGHRFPGAGRAGDNLLTPGHIMSCCHTTADIARLCCFGALAAYVLAALSCSSEPSRPSSSSSNHKPTVVIRTAQILSVRARAASCGALPGSRLCLIVVPQLLVGDVLPGGGHPTADKPFWRRPAERRQRAERRQQQRQRWQRPCGDGCGLLPAAHSRSWRHTHTGACTVARASSVF